MAHLGWLQELAGGSTILFLRFGTFSLCSRGKLHFFVVDICCLNSLFSCLLDNWMTDFVFLGEGNLGFMLSSPAYEKYKWLFFSLVGDGVCLLQFCETGQGIFLASLQVLNTWSVLGQSFRKHAACRNSAHISIGWKSRNISWSH